MLKLFYNYDQVPCISKKFSEVHEFGNEGLSKNNQQSHGKLDLDYFVVTIQTTQYPTYSPIFKLNFFP